jgi:hypothetical protein
VLTCCSGRRLARYRLQLADTWTYLAGGHFLARTVIIILGFSRPW